MRTVALAVAGAFAALAQTAFAQTPAPAAPPPTDYSKVEIKPTDLTRNVWMLEGAGGNITVAVGTDGIIMVDGQFAPLHDKIKAAIEAISKQPIKFLINTHFHGDHTGGNALFTKDGVTIIAQQNVRERLAAGTINGLTGAKTPPAAPEALPAKTYTDLTVVKVKGQTARLRHPLNAHTDGDTYVFFPEADVLSTGDTFANGRYPNIDFANGGNIRGMIAATETYLQVTDTGTRIVPGHGPLAKRTDLTDYHTMLTTARTRVQALIQQGKSEQEAVDAKPMADFDKKWAPSDQAAQNFIRVVYNSLKPKRK